MKVHLPEEGWCWGRGAAKGAILEKTSMVGWGTERKPGEEGVEEEAWVRLGERERGD